jgi:virginiamycin B lyase
MSSRAREAGGLVTVHLVRRVLVLFGVLLTACVGVAAAAPVGQITEFAAPGSNIAQVRAGPDGNLWFTDRAGAIGRITTGGAITRFTSGLNAGAQPFSLAVGPDGNLWFTDAGMTSAIGKIDPTTQAITEFSAGLNAGSKPAGIALGPDGKLWFTDRGSPAAVGVIDPVTHAIAEYSAGLNPGSVPQQGITAAPDGNVWFTDQGTTRAIGMLDPATHAITEFSSGLSAASAPGAAIAVGTDGNLWFTDNSSTTPAIGMINPTSHAIAEFGTGAGSVPGRLAVGPDGNVWFTDKGTTPAIGFIDPTSHAITKFPAGLNAGSLPGGINSGADGSLWFTDQGSIRAMGRAGTGAPAASVTPPSVTGTGGVGVAQTCGGDTWASWAGQQPSRAAFRFDGYQWLEDGSPISGATGTSYTPTADQAGHALSCEVTVTYALLQVTVSATSAEVAVEGAAEQLVGLAGAVVDAGPGASLAHKVATIQDDVAANDSVDACAELVAFSSEVKAQTGKKVGTAQAASLLDRTQGVEAALGCQSDAA